MLDASRLRWTALLLSVGVAACSEKPEAPALRPSLEHLELSEPAYRAAGLELATVGPATLRVSEELPAEVTVDSRRVAKLAPIVSGTVRQVRRKLGDRVSRGEVVAIIESLEMADARLKYIEATHRRRFAQEALRREEMLYRKKISAEEEFLRRRHASEEAQIAQDVARQHLEVFGMPSEAIAKLEGRERGRLADCSLKAPAAGTILEMSAVVGGPVARGKELLVVADLSRVLLEVRVPVGLIGRLRGGASAPSPLRTPRAHGLRPRDLPGARGRPGDAHHSRAPRGGQRPGRLAAWLDGLGGAREPRREGTGGRPQRGRAHRGRSTRGLRGGAAEDLRAAARDPGQDRRPRDRRAAGPGSG